MRVARRELRNPPPIICPAMATAGYAGSRGVHLFRIGDANLAPEQILNGVKVYQPELGRRNPNFTTIGAAYTPLTAHVSMTGVTTPAAAVAPPPRPPCT